ncbi:MAG: VOC family protein [Acidobacteria bacterium]|nr:VOC family protein [Acidobacteriota bacterium]
MIRLIDVAHVNLNVSDVARSEKFYSEVLGFRTSGKVEGQVCWMNLGQYREGHNLYFHDLALYHVPKGLPDDYRKRIGLNHAAFRLKSPEEVDKAAEFLKSKDVKILKGPGTHSEDHDRYLYFEDPDGNVLELVATTLPDYPQAYLRPDWSRDDHS